MSATSTMSEAVTHNNTGHQNGYGDDAATTTENSAASLQHGAENTLPTAIDTTAADNDNKVVVASVTTATAVKRPAWGSISSTTTAATNNVAAVSSSSSTTQNKKKTFAEIMAEENQDKEAANVALYGELHNMSLVEMQAEQERLFLLAAKQQQQSLASSAQPQSEDIIEGLDPEELRMIEEAMKESLKDEQINNIKNDSSSFPTSRSGDVGYRRSSLSSSYIDNFHYGTKIP